MLMNRQDYLFKTVAKQALIVDFARIPKRRLREYHSFLFENDFLYHRHFFSSIIGVLLFYLNRKARVVNPNPFSFE